MQLFGSPGSHACAFCDDSFVNLTWLVAHLTWLVAHLVSHHRDAATVIGKERRRFRVYKSCVHAKAFTSWVVENKVITYLAHQP